MTKHRPVLTSEHAAQNTNAQMPVLLAMPLLSQKSHHTKNVIEVAAASQKTQHLPTCSCVTNCHVDQSTQTMLPMIWHLLLTLHSLFSEVTVM